MDIHVVLYEHGEGDFYFQNLLVTADVNTATLPVYQALATEVRKYCPESSDFEIQLGVGYPGTDYARPAVNYCLKNNATLARGVETRQVTGRNFKPVY
jgi:hypothetical protein